MRTTLKEVKMSFEFKQVDVFSADSCQGNPVCVFLTSDGLSTKDMQRIANWTNLSETTFISPSKVADYKVRIFTPNEELPFAGHPTLGSAWAYWEFTNSTKNILLQECAFGIVEIKKNDECVSFTLPQFTIKNPAVNYLEIEQALNTRAQTDCMMIDTGPYWIIANVPSTKELDTLYVNDALLLALFQKEGATGICLYALEGKSVHVRTFFDAGSKIVEDPVCGSGNAAIAVHIQKTGRDQITGPKYKAYQGKFLGRDGKIFVKLGEKIVIGGQCNTVFSGNASYN